MALPRPAVIHRLAAVVLLSLPATGMAAQMAVPTGRETLRGLSGVEVIVEPLQAELESAGLTTGALQAAVSARLADAGVPVFASQAENPSPAQAYLYVHVNALPLPEAGLQAVALALQVRQAVDSLVGPARIVDAVTWDAHNVLALPAGDPGGLFSELETYVDRFIDDWRAVH